MMSLTGHTIGDSGYHPTATEQMIFFIVENGYDALRRAMADDCDFFTKEAQDHSNSSMTTVMISAIVSIIAIVFIGFVITPILSRSVERRYQSL